MRKRSPEKVKPRQLGPCQGFDSKTTGEDGSNGANSRTSAAAVQDAAFARFMQAAQQPIPQAFDWPFSRLTREMWNGLPRVCREALDDQITTVLQFWEQQHRSQ